MPIEFRCSRCGKLLRTGDDTAGRQAQCPNCGTIDTVPGQAAPRVEPPAASPYAEPLGGAPETESPFRGAGEFENPYRSPGAAGMFVGGSLAAAMNRVAGPALALIILGLLNLVACLGVALLYGFIFAMTAAGQGGAFAPGEDPNQLMLGSGALVIGAILHFLLSILILFGAFKMKRLENYLVSVVAAVIAVLPCTSPCCVIGLPFGIWALVVLSDPAVKNAFRS